MVGTIHYFVLWREPFQKNKTIFEYTEQYLLLWLMPKPWSEMNIEQHRSHSYRSLYRNYTVTYKIPNTKYENIFKDIYSTTHTYSLLLWDTGFQRNKLIGLLSKNKLVWDLYYTQTERPLQHISSKVRVSVVELLN